MLRNVVVFLAFRYVALALRAVAFALALEVVALLISLLFHYSASSMPIRKLLMRWHHSLHNLAENWSWTRDVNGRDRNVCLPRWDRDIDNFSRDETLVYVSRSRPRPQPCVKCRFCVLRYGDILAWCQCRIYRPTICDSNVELAFSCTAITSVSGTSIVSVNNSKAWEAVIWLEVDSGAWALVLCGGAELPARATQDRVSMSAEHAKIDLKWPY